MFRDTTPTTLRVARAARGLRALDAAQHLGVNESILARYERGDLPVPPRVLAKLAAFYNVGEDILRGAAPMLIRAKAPRIA